MTDRITLANAIEIPEIQRLIEAACVLIGSSATGCNDYGTEYKTVGDDDLEELDAAIDAIQGVITQDTGSQAMTPNPAIRYLLFRCPGGESCGGMDDCVDGFAAIDEARESAKVFDAHTLGKWTDDHIYDTWTGEYPPVIQDTGSQRSDP